jgi:Lipopolysaccharide kinase (Kdo/WaaP) family
VYPNFVLRQYGSCKIWLDSHCAAPKFLLLLKNPDKLFDFPTCEVVKDQRKIKVAKVEVNMGGEKCRIYVKRYNSFSLRHRFGSMFTVSGGLKSLRGAAILNRNGINTAVPVAAVEERIQRTVARSFYLSREISGGCTVDAYWLATLKPLPALEGVRRRRAFLQNLGELFRTLHSHGVYHNDLKDANILAAPAWNGDSIRLYLLDLEGVRQYRVLSESRRIKNLVQLNRTLGHQLTGTQRMRFLRAYLAGSFLDRGLRRGLTAKVIGASNRLDSIKARQRAGSAAVLST